MTVLLFSSNIESLLLFSRRSGRSRSATRSSSTARSRAFCGERGGALELRARLVVAAELREQVAAHGRQQVVAAQRRLASERVDQLERRLRAERHPDRDRAVELHHRRRRELGESVVEGDDALPVGVLGDPGARVAGGDRGLQRVRAEGAAGRSARARARRARGRRAASPSATRSWSSSRTGSPAGPIRARERDACSSISATRPCTSGSAGSSSARMRPSRSASSISSGRIQSSPAVAA